MKKIKGIYDFHGLENGFGCSLIVGELNKGQINFIDVIDDETGIIIHRLNIIQITDTELLHKLGFSFKLRASEEEIMAQYTPKEFKFHESNYYIIKQDDGTYNFTISDNEKILGAICFTEKDCLAILRELED